MDGTTRVLPGPVLPDRDREPDRAGGDVPAARGAARPLPAAHVAGLPGRRTRSCASWTTSSTGHPLDATPPRDRARPSSRPSSQRSRRSTSIPLLQALDRRPGAGDARARHRRRSAPRFAGASRSSASRAPGRCCMGAPFVAPEDVEDLFLPVLGHRLRDRTRADARRRLDAAAGESSASSRLRWRAPRGPGARLGRRGARGHDMTVAAPRPFPLVPRRRFLGRPVRPPPHLAPRRR